jgi:hypothetical protein
VFIKSFHGLLNNVLTITDDTEVIMYISNETAKTLFTQQYITRGDIHDVLMNPIDSYDASYDPDIKVLSNGSIDVHINENWNEVIAAYWSC